MPRGRLRPRHLKRFDAWNAERKAGGEAPIEVAVGLHYGPVVVGDIGASRRLQLAVVGDTVNVASRIEALTRKLECRAAISQAVVEAVRTEDAGRSGDLLDGFEERGGQPIRGREETVGIWALG